MFSKEEITAVYQARKLRLVNPAGSFDKAGRWYPSAAEAAVMASVRSPSRAWPYSYLLACRTRKHVAALTADQPLYFARCLAEARATVVVVSPLLVAA